MLRKPIVPKVPLSKRTQQLNKPTVTTRFSQSKSVTKTVVKTALKTNAGTAKSACELSIEPPLSEDVDRLDEKAVPLQSIELPVGDDYQPNGDKFIKVGDHLESSTPSPPSMQEQIDIRRKLSEDLEVERSERKRLESDSQRLKSQIQTLQMRIDKRPAAVHNPPLSASNTQQQQKSVGNRNRQTNKVVAPEIRPPAVDVDDADTPIKDQNGGSEETVDGLRAELDGDWSKISDLETTGNRLLDCRCAALESEVVDLKTALNLANVRAETLEKENADLKSELDNEMQLHSTEIAKLSDQAHLSLEKFEKLENDNAELVRKLAESAKARSEEVETWAKKIRQAVTENEAMKDQTGQHDMITQHLKDLQRKENFIVTLKSENEQLCRKNKALELKIELLEREEKTGMHQSRGLSSGDEHVGCRKQFERLQGEVEDTKRAFKNLWTIHDQETLALKRANRENEEQYRNYVNEQKKRFDEEIEKLKNTIAKKNKTNDLLRKGKDKIKHTGYMNDGRLIDIVSSEEEDDEKFVALRYIGD